MYVLVWFVTALKYYYLCIYLPIGTFDFLSSYE